MSIRVGMRAMARPPMGAPEVPPAPIFTEDFDWKEAPPTFALVFAETFSGWP